MPLSKWETILLSPLPDLVQVINLLITI